MPKDATKNVDRYKVRGGTLNEYEFEQGKTADKKQKAADLDRQGIGRQQGPDQKPQKSPSKKASKKK